MQNLQDLQEKIYFESKNILDNLSKINSREELLAKQDLFAELSDRIAFLRILEKNKDAFELVVESTNSQQFNGGDDHNLVEEIFDDSFDKNDIIEEEVIFTNEINDFSKEANEESQNEDQIVNADTPYSTHLPSDNIDEEEMQEVENVEINNLKVEDQIEEEKKIPFLVEQEDPDYESRVLQKEKEFLESEERRRKIVEFQAQSEIPPTMKEPAKSKNTLDNLQEKKFKLSNIKGLKAVQNLFDDDPLENLTEEKTDHLKGNSEAGSILKTNIPTDFMEAPKKQPEFKLDFNDKIAFTKLLFNGDELALKKTVEQLNSYQNIEEARQYLSEVYYQRDWQKVDEYAQRLWDLLESKF